MSETSGFITTQKKISANVDIDFKKLFNRVADKLGLDSEEYGITDVIQMAFKKIDEKFNPKVSKPEDLKKIKELENKVSELLNEKENFDNELKEAKKYHKNIVEDNENLFLKNEELKKQIADNKETDKQSFEQYKSIVSEKEGLEKQVSELMDKLHSKVSLTENQVILSLSEYQEKYLLDIIKDKKFIHFLKAQNLQGKLNGIIEPLIANEKEDIGRALLGFFFYSAKLGKFPLISFNKWLKKQK